MPKVFPKCILTLVLLANANIAIATPESLFSQESYKESVALLKKYGHEALINNIVKMQREQMKKYGNALDEYTNVIGIIGSQFGTTQTITVKLEKLLNEINEKLKAKGKKQLSRDEVISFLRKGGMLYNSQVNMLCSNPSTRALIDNDVEYTSKFYDLNMSFLSEILIDSSVCLESERL